MMLQKQTVLDALAREPARKRRALRAFVTAVLFGGMALLASPGCSDEGVGDPCTPEKEYDPHFLDFDSNEVYTESKSFQCRTRLCLVNHFQGRVSCPYGQNGDGNPPAGSDRKCTVPGDVSTQITGEKEGGEFVDQRKKSTVRAQCLDRIADKAVYCSCRCADINGNRPSDQTFCDCPDGFACERLVTATSSNGNEGLTGSYCIKRGTTFDSAASCNEGTCDATTHPCP